jgi:hypothetical protein
MGSPSLSLSAIRWPTPAAARGLRDDGDVSRLLRVGNLQCRWRATWGASISQYSYGILIPISPFSTLIDDWLRKETTFSAKNRPANVLHFNTMLVFHLLNMLDFSQSFIKLGQIIQFNILYIICGRKSSMASVHCFGYNTHK